MNFKALLKHCFNLFALTLPIEGVLVSGISISKISAFFLFVFYLLSFRDFKPIQFSIIGVYFSFLIYSLFSFFWCFDPESGFSLLLTYLQNFFLVIVITQIIVDEREIFQFFLSFSFGTIIASIDVIFNFLTNRSFKNIDYAEDYEAIRFSAFDVDPNETAVLIVIGMVFLLYLLISVNVKRLKLLALVGLAISFVGLILTASRTGFLLFVISILGYSFWFKTSFKNYVIYFLLLITFGLLFLYGNIFPPNTLERLFSSLDSISSGHFNSRELAWQNALNVIGHNPIKGVGIGSLSYAMNYYGLMEIASHNTYLSILAQFGLIGFGLFLYLIFKSLYIFYKHLVTCKYLLLQFIVLAIGISTLTYDQRKLFWVYLAFAIVLENSKQRQL